MAISSSTLSILHRSSKAALDGGCIRHYSLVSSFSTFDKTSSNNNPRSNTLYSAATDDCSNVHRRNDIVSRFASTASGNKRYHSHFY